jgi:hypothetical protein
MVDEYFEDCLRIVEHIIFEFGNGKMPDRAALIALLMNKFAVAENLPPEVRDKISLREWEQVRSNFAAGLALGYDCLCRQQTARWRN